NDRRAGRSFLGDGELRLRSSGLSKGAGPDRLCWAAWDGSRQVRGIDAEGEVLTESGRGCRGWIPEGRAREPGHFRECSADRRCSKPRDAYAICGCGSFRKEPGWKVRVSFVF